MCTGDCKQMAIQRHSTPLITIFLFVTNEYTIVLYCNNCYLFHTVADMNRSTQYVASVTNGLAPPLHLANHTCCNAVPKLILAF